MYQFNKYIYKMSKYILVATQTMGNLMSGRGLFQEIVIGVIPVVLGIGALLLLPDHQFFKHGFPSPTTPDFFPSLVGVFLVLLGLFLLARVKQSEDIQKETHEAMVTLPVYQTCTVFIVFWLVLNFIGFIASSALTILGLAYIFHERFRWQLLVFAIGFPLIVSQVFKRSANVYLPSGLWF